MARATAKRDPVRSQETFTKPEKVKRTCNRVRIVTETTDEETKIKFVRYPCEHGISDRGFLCKMCKGNGLCRHEKQKQRCKDCKEEALALANLELVVELDNKDTSSALISSSSPYSFSTTAISTNTATSNSNTPAPTTTITNDATIVTNAATTTTTTNAAATTNQQVTFAESNTNTNT